MTDDDIQAYLEIKRPLCCGFNEIKEYLESNIVLCCGPEDTSELDKYLGTSNAPECLLELFLDEKKVNDPEYIIKVAKLPTPDVIGHKLNIKIASSKRLVNIYKECDKLIVQSEAALEQYNESSIPSKIIKSILSWIALVNTGKNIDSFKTLTSGTYSRKQKKMRYGASRNLCLQGIKLAKTIKYLIMEELEKRANNEKKKDIVARRFIKNNPDTTIQESYEIDIENVVNNLNTILCEQIGGDIYMYEEYDTEYFDTFLESLDPELESKYTDKVDDQLAKNKDPEYIDNVKMPIAFNSIAINLKKQPTDVIEKSIKSLTTLVKELEQTSEQNKNFNIIKRNINKVLANCVVGFDRNKWDSMSAAKAASYNRKIISIMKKELAERKKQGVKESMYEEEFDTEYFDTFLESLDYDELIFEESFYSKKVDKRLNKNQSDSFIKKTRLKTMLQPIVIGVKRLSDDAIKEQIKTCEKQISLLEKEANNNKNENLKGRVLKKMLKTISGDSVPVASLDALSQAEMATQYRKISQILK